ncbi:OmpP1/FadL family transporter [Methylomonas methanica]|nr:outer membrane protein transport protein [Methylomonas methanica]
MPSAVMADGFRIAYHSSVAAGQAMAYAAQADDPSALYYNPAGLTQVRGLQGSFGVALMGANVNYTSPTGYKATGDLGGWVASPPPSSLYITANLQDLGFEVLGPLSMGLGLDTSYGLITRYPESVPFSTVVSNAKLPMLDIKPTVAYRLADWLSIGMGADIYTFADFLGSGGFEQQTVIAGVGKTEIFADGTTAAYNASLLLTPWSNGDGKPRLNLGFVYRSGGKFPLEGNYRVNGTEVAKVKTALELPDIYTAALAYWPIRNNMHEWKLEYDMDFSNWSNFHALDLQFSTGTTASMPANWGSGQSINAGTEFKWLDPGFMLGWNVALRAGYNRSETPIPNQTYNPSIPENSWNMFAVGLGVDCHKGGRFLGLFECGRGNGFRPSNIGVDLAFQTYFFEPRKVTANIYPGVDGTYDTTLFMGSLNINVAY